MNAGNSAGSTVIGWRLMRLHSIFFKKSFFRLLGAIVLLGALSTPFSDAQTPTHKSAPRSSSPDVYLITIDTLRADHVGCYGYKQIETPALNALAADGVRFTQAFTHSPITNTSHITIMTGLLPSVHGVTDFGVPLSPQHVTAAELLKKHGYQTAAFIGSRHSGQQHACPGTRSRLRFLRQLSLQDRQ